MVKKFVIKLNILLLSLFYKKKYMTGKHFEKSKIGFLWCWRGLFRIGKLHRHRIYFPVSKLTRVSNGDNIEFDNSSLNIFQQPGCFFQNYSAKIVIGKDVHIAANVGIITQNHNPANPNEHMPAQSVTIGDNCWIGMNAIILPGVTLGPYTTVGAGAVVTHSFNEGHCVIAGNPARVIRTFEIDKVEE